MKTRRRRKLAVLGDLRRLIAPLDVLYTVGNLIYRRTLRYTLFTAGIAVLGRLAQELGLPGFTVRQALLLPLLIGMVSLTVGTMLKVVPSLIASRLLTVAQAGDLNLMEDYRKSQTEEHLNALWERLFQHECRLRMAAGAGRRSDGLRRKGETEVEAYARAKRSFFARAQKALASHLPQIDQMHLVGLDLRYLEDWRDGAYLDRSDTKLNEQFDGNSTLTDARRQVGLTGPAAAVLFGTRRFAQRLWFLFITRTVAIQVGGGIQRLNRTYGTDLFNCQAILWPGTEDAAWLGAHEGAREEVLRRRRQMLRRIFGEDFETACHVLDHMLYCSFARATELRMRFDPDYCDGSLGYDVVADLRAEGRNRRDFQRAEAFVRTARADLAALKRFLEARRPEMLEVPRAEALRAVRIAFHVDLDGLKRLVTSPHAAPGDAAKAVERIGQAAGDTARIIRRLIAVRMHHELTRLSRQGYRDLLRKLAYSGRAEPADE